MGVPFTIFLEGKTVTVWNVKKRSGDKNSLSRDMNFIYMRSFPLDCRIDIEFVSFRFLFDYRR